MDSLLSTLYAVFGGFSDSGAVVNADDSTVKEALKEVRELAKELGEDGEISFVDAGKIIAKAAGVLVKLAEDISKQGSGTEKKKFVVDACVELYEYIDRGGDGSKNRIDIPWIPSSIERKIEDFVVPIVVDVAIEAAVMAYNKAKD